MIAGYVAVMPSSKQRLRVGTPTLHVGTLSTLTAHPLATFFIEKATLQRANCRAALSWSQRNVAAGRLIARSQIDVS